MDKATLMLEGTTLLARSVDLLKPLVDSVHVGIRADQVSDELRRNFAVLVDPPAIAGPAAALYGAWLHDSGAAWLVLACDMPAVDGANLEALIAARDPARGGTAWRSSDRDLPEPLCAIWEPATLARLATVARQPGNGLLSPRAMLAAADPLLLNPGRSFALSSVNTPADLHRYLEQTNGHKP